MKRRLLSVVTGALALGLAALSPGQQVAEIVAITVPGTNPIVDPSAPLWRDARPVDVTLLPQTIVVPQKPDAAVRQLQVRAAHNAQWLAFRLEWADPTESNHIVLDNFGDQVAVELPVDPHGPAPSPMMGNPGGRVNIMQWRAAFQRDIDRGPPTVQSLYPNAWADVYPDQVLSVSDARAYTGALGVENPISRAAASPVLDQMAEGWGTMTVKPEQYAVGRGVWKDGRWAVVIARPLVSDDLNGPRLARGDRTVVAFAVWEGGNGEVGSRKSWSTWVPLVIGSGGAQKGESVKRQQP
ncbi:Chlorate reductase subunit gamma [bacterium HR30]|nr:Chlorate reductase subunit gamma [bacterium HR30]